MLASKHLLAIVCVCMHVVHVCGYIHVCAYICVCVCAYMCVCVCVCVEGGAKE